MVTSLVLKGTYKIGLNAARKIKLNTGTADEPKDVLVAIDKDVPFIRYRYDNYGDAEITYIKSMMETFKNSVHLIEINLDANTLNVINLLKSAELYDKVAKYIYINIDDSNVSVKNISDENISYLEQIKENKFDRIMIRDKSTTLDSVAANTIIKNMAKIIDSKDIQHDFGICSSPLSFGESACLTAVKARELMSMYNIPSDMSIPSANHQCMNCCGCIRYYEINADMEAPADSSSNTRSKKESTLGETKKVTKPNKQLNFGAFSL